MVEERRQRKSSITQLAREVFVFHRKGHETAEALGFLPQHRIAKELCSGVRIELLTAGDINAEVVCLVSVVEELELWLPP